MPQHYIELYLPALLDCYGDTVAIAAVEAALVEKADWAEKVLRDDPKKLEFIVSQLEDLSRDLRNGFAAWLYHRGHDSEVAAIWARYGAAEIARRHLPQLDRLPTRLAESQSAPVPDAAHFDAYGETVEGRLDKLAAEGARDFSLDYDAGSTERIIELEWPSPKAIAAARGIVQRSNGSPLVTAFVVGLEHQLSCAPSEATMQTLLDDISTLKDPLDQARAIIVLLRFVQPPVADTAAAAQDCIVD